MAENEKEKTLVNVLERLASEMTRLEERFDLLLTQQNDLTGTIEVSSLLLRGKQDNTERTYDKLLEGINHYRSDMLSLVNEQDHINENIAKLQEELKTATFTIGVTGKKLVELEESLARHEKETNLYHEQSTKQSDLFKVALDNTARDFTRLHAETEKHIAELQRQIEEKLQSFQHETAKRLLLLDNITTDLQTLIARTEPAEKKPFWLNRLLIKMRSIFRRV